MKNVGQSRVTVLLASHNGERWIADQVESILGQEDVAVILNVRDDASTDGTLKMVRQADRSGIVQIEQAESPGGSAARNFLAMISACPAEDADCVALSDQDDIWLPRKLQRAAECLAGSGCAGYSCASIAFWPDGRQEYLGQNRGKFRADYLFEGAGQGCTFVLRAEFYRRVRSFLLENPDLARHVHFHDWAIYALARSWGLGWYFDTQPMLRYRQHAGNDTGARSGVPGALLRLGRIRQGWYTAQLRAIAGICQRAAPDNVDVATWIRTLGRSPGLARRLHIAWFAAIAGRRRPVDRFVLIMAALAGWI